MEANPYNELTILLQSSLIGCYYFHNLVSKLYLQQLKYIELTENNSKVEVDNYLNDNENIESV